MLCYGLYVVWGMLPAVHDGSGAVAPTGLRAIGGRGNGMTFWEVYSRP